MKIIAAALVSASWLLGATTQAQITIPSKYSVTNVQAYDLGTLGGKHSQALDINDLGDIVGYANDTNDVGRAFIRLVGQSQNLALDDGSISFLSAQANGINNNRVVVGHYFGSDPVYGGWYNHGFYYYPGIWMSEIDSDGYGLGYPWTVRPFAINNLDYIVGGGHMHPLQGNSHPPDTTGVCYTDHLPLFWNGAGQHPFALNCYPDPDNNGTGYLGMLPAAMDINDSNWVVGADGGDSTYGMFLRKGVQTTQNTPVPRPAGSSTGLYGWALGINNAGHVVGVYGYQPNGVASPEFDAFIWNGTDYLSKKIGVLPGGDWSIAYEINDQDMVVGVSNRDYVLGGAGNSAYIWHADFGMFRLPAPGESYPLLKMKSCEARAVNNRKSTGLVEAVGWCSMPSGTRAVLWQITVAKKPNVPL